jgi:uncharacterized protein (DUF433 family)
MNYLDRIISDPKVMLGKPVIKGTRITVEIILKKLAEGATVKDILEMYPHLIEDDVNAALFYASEVIAREEIISPAS